MTPARWYIAGPLMGLLIVGLRAAGSPASIVAVTTFFATGVAFAHLLNWF